jgi:hypothetical protein
LSENIIDTNFVVESPKPQTPNPHLDNNMVFPILLSPSYVHIFIQPYIKHLSLAKVLIPPPKLIISDPFNPDTIIPPSPEPETITEPEIITDLEPPNFLT